jgi:hypothetical protein
MDDLLKRGGVALVIFFGGLIFAEVMMNIGGVKPIGFAAVVFSGIESMLKGLFYIVGAVGILIAVVGAIAEIDRSAKKAANEKEQLNQLRIREVNQRRAEIKYERKERERKREKEEADRLWKEELARKEIEKIEYLKTRSAADANRDALKDFL